MPVVVRAATAADAEGISNVHIGAWQVAYRGLVADDFLDGLSDRLAGRIAWWHERLGAGATAVVADDDGRVTGFASYGRAEAPSDPELGEVYAIYVDASQWGRGHGRALMRAALDALRAMGRSVAVLWVLESNARARRFYERGGWAPDGATKTERIGGAPVLEVRYRRAIGS